MPTSTAWRPDCETAVRELWDYLDRELPAPDMASIDAHLAACERCRAHFAFERRLIEEIRAGQQFVATFRPGAAAVQPSAPLAGPRGVGQGARGQQQPGRGRLGDAARGRAGQPPPPVRLPLTGWQEYAHALLLTNEAAFVN